MADFNANKAFNPEATAYNSGNALWLGQVAKLVYEEFASIETLFAGWKLYPLADRKTDTQGLVVGRGDTIVIAFRGTEPAKIKDWLTDLQIPLIEGPKGMVHRGFLTRLLAVWPQLTTALLELQPAEKKVWITGHSLGASLAALAAAKLMVEGMAGVDGLYTYGQPRTGNRQFAEWLDTQIKQRYFRHVNDKDIVTNVPLPPLYKHAGTLEYFDSEGKRQKDVRFWTIMKDRIVADSKALARGTLRPEAVKDHPMQGYLVLLEKNL